ncbi:PREDICTED: uncharacterized protein LOC104982568 [Bison bison bison]|uniref:Uncharacterized protein LOC104982568 n=1 Tax=Bison bison bison TaxID=43346 RepID=A0A6P3GUF0_BISBB|nr:PREDICTED: uncharacterized protein LOC104982568 [Bison bison bison]
MIQGERGERERRAFGEEQQAGGGSGIAAGRGNLTLRGQHLPGPYSRRRKEPVCVLRLPCDSGSCLLAGASIPTQLDWGATLPGAAKRANETTKKHKMNRQSNQPKVSCKNRLREGNPYCHVRKQGPGMEVRAPKLMAGWPYEILKGVSASKRKKTRKPTLRTPSIK